MKTISISKAFTALLISALFSANISITGHSDISQDPDVYICSGPYSKKYHFSKNCRGLSNCSTEITKVKRSKAREMGRGLCGLED